MVLCCFLARDVIDYTLPVPSTLHGVIYLSVKV